MQASEFIHGMAVQCVNKLKENDFKDPEGEDEIIQTVEHYMLKLIVDLGTVGG